MNNVDFLESIAFEYREQGFTPEKTYFFLEQAVKIAIDKAFKE